MGNLQQKINRLEAKRKRLLAVLKEEQRLRTLGDESRRLKNEVKRLKRETSNSLASKIRRAAKDPRTKAQLMALGRKLKSGGKKFQKFANRFG